MVALILVAVVVMLAALWLVQRRPRVETQPDEPPFEHRPWPVDTTTLPGPARPMPNARRPTPFLPERDSWETGILINEDRQLLFELPAWIHYRDATGQESRRDILVKRLVEQQEGGAAILAFCEARQATRTFVLARILQFVDRQTGEVVADVSGHLWSAYCETPRGRVERALTDRGAEANMLAFIARADGTMRQKQRDLIGAYMTGADGGLAGCDAELASAISGLRPVQADYRKHVRAVQAKPEPDRAALLAAAEALAATRTTKREFTDSALAVARKALGPQPPPKPKRVAKASSAPNSDATDAPTEETKPGGTDRTNKTTGDIPL